MGNLARAAAPGGFGPPDLRKGIISIFANLDAAAVTAKRAEVQAWNDAPTGGAFYNMMFGIIPLHTWGPQQTATIYSFGTTDTVTIDTFPGGTAVVGLTGITASHTAETPPSFIGVFVGSTSSPELSLIVHLQCQHGPSCTNTVSIDTGAHWDPPGSAADVGQIVYDDEDASYVDENAQDYFGNSRMANRGISAFFGRPAISAGTDVTFNVIVAWDFTNGAASHGVAPDAADEIGISAGADTVSKMWCAIDGVNKDGYDLPASWSNDDIGSGDPNTILSWFTAAQSGKYGGTTGAPSATLTMTSTSIPFYPVSIPSPLSLNREGASIVPNPLVRVGRLQFFADPLIDASKLDLSNPSNVLAFRNEDGTPAAVSAARTRLGVDPLEEFATATAMINGANSGGAGSFTKTGTVTAFTG